MVFLANVRGFLPRHFFRLRPRKVTRSPGFDRNGGIPSRSQPDERAASLARVGGVAERGVVGCQVGVCRRKRGVAVDRGMAAVTMQHMLVDVLASD